MITAAIAPFDTLTPTILTYGAKVLLNTATLRLKRGHRYGLCDKNGIGKSTLMGEIPNGQVEGFPPPDEVRAFYVEHDIDGSEENTSVLQSVLSDEHILADEKEIVETLASVGFSDERQQHVIGSLSGGWKMKLALARAMLFKADTLCSMSRPTTWTSGNLQSFVKQVLKAKFYYTLEAMEDYKFKLPDPPLLEGVKTKETSLLKTCKTGEDVEEMSKANCQISEEEHQKMKDGSLIVIEGQKRIIDEITNCKKLKQSYEYEVSFKGLSTSENIWLLRDDFVKRRFEKHRAAAGRMHRTILQAALPGTAGCEHLFT
ncbi:hypothetical protein EW146_g9482 [Bondarzewia mesenterica]|uniref:ABC transporter domain-containing protein n=1 Tax=Bondarzewia mesenterica TaxID=1095465 RepID=A0A4S4L5W6_9AGAM|nr:hypothetical protein EW146_g9482 [Bondarzewia mesenterica]